MNRHQAVFTKLGVPNEDDAAGQIDVAAIEPNCFARSQACAGQQPDQRRQCVASQRNPWRNEVARADQRSQLDLAKDARWRDRAGSGEGPALQDLSAEIIDGQILVESTEHAMTNGAAIGGAAERQDEVQRHRPGGGRIESNALDVADEGPQCARLLVESVAESTA